MPKTKAVKKDPNKPKRALTGFLFYRYVVSDIYHYVCPIGHTN